MGAGQGTVRIDDTHIKVRDAQDGDDYPVVLTHGSVNMGNTNAYMINPDETPKYNQYTNTSNNWRYKNNLSIKDVGDTTRHVDVYVAVSWTMTFTYTFAGDTNPVAIYLNLGESAFDTSDPGTPYDFTFNDSADLDTQKAFRIGFYNAVYAAGETNAGDAAANRHNVVWGNNVPEDAVAWADDGVYAIGDVVLKDGKLYKAVAAKATDDPWTPASWTELKGAITYNKSLSTDATYVSSTSDPVAKYVAKEYVTTTTPYTRVAEDAEYEATLGNAERICVLTAAQHSVTVTCAAWFEGTDPNVVTGAKMRCLDADMHFYARPVKSGAAS